MNSSFGNGSYSQKFSKTPKSTNNKFPQIANQSLKSSNRHNFDLGTPNMNLKSNLDKESSNLDKTGSNLDIANQMSQAHDTGFSVPSQNYLPKHKFISSAQDEDYSMTMTPHQQKLVNKYKGRNQEEKFKSSKLRKNPSPFLTNTQPQNDFNTPNISSQKQSYLTSRSNNNTLQNDFNGFSSPYQTIKPSQKPFNNSPNKAHQTFRSPSLRDKKKNKFTFTSYKPKSIFELQKSPQFFQTNHVLGKQRDGSQSIEKTNDSTLQVQDSTIMFNKQKQRENSLQDIQAETPHQIFQHHQPYETFKGDHLQSLNARNRNQQSKIDFSHSMSKASQSQIKSRRQFGSTIVDSKTTLLANKVPLAPELIMLKNVQKNFYEEISYSQTQNSSNNLYKDNTVSFDSIHNSKAFLFSQNQDMNSKATLYQQLSQSRPFLQQQYSSLKNQSSFYKSPELGQIDSMYQFMSPDQKREIIVLLSGVRRTKGIIQKKLKKQLYAKIREAMDNGGGSTNFGAPMIRDQSIKFLQDPYDNQMNIQNSTNINSYASLNQAVHIRVPTQDSPQHGAENSQKSPPQNPFFKTYASEPLVEENYYTSYLQNNLPILREEFEPVQMTKIQNKYAPTYTYNNQKELYPKFEHFLQSVQKTLMLKTYAKKSGLLLKYQIKSKHRVKSSRTQLKYLEQSRSKSKIEHKDYSYYKSLLKQKKLPGQVEIMRRLLGIQKIKQFSQSQLLSLRAASYERQKNKLIQKMVQRHHSDSSSIQQPRFVKNGTQFINFEIPEEPVDDMNQTVRSSMYKSASQKQAVLVKNDSLKKIARKQSALKHIKTDEGFITPMRQYHYEVNTPKVVEQEQTFEKIRSINTIYRAVKHITIKKQVFLVERSKIIQQTYILMAQVMEDDRSNTSKASNPLYSQNIQLFGTVVKSGVFLCPSNKQYQFRYQIHTDGRSTNLNPECSDPGVCWSVFVKIGKRTEEIFKFHKFSDKILSTVYRNYKHQDEFEGESPVSISSFLEDGLFDNPIEKLGKYLKMVATQVCSNILDEAEQFKFNFLENKEEREEWEEEWIELMRQQLHLEV